MVSVSPLSSTCGFAVNWVQQKKKESLSPVSSPVGCCCGGAGPCKSRQRAHWASAPQPHTPAPPRAHALSHAEPRPRRLQVTGFPRDCGEPACSGQIFPGSQLLPRPAQTQSGLRQTQDLIGWTRTIDLWSATQAAFFLHALVKKDKNL